MHSNPTRSTRQSQYDAAIGFVRELGTKQDGASRQVIEAA